MSVMQGFSEFQFSFCEVFMLKIKTTCLFSLFYKTFGDIVSAHKYNYLQLRIM